MKKEFKNILVTLNLANIRLDQFLAKSQAYSSRSQALKCISKKEVSLNNIPLKASYLVQVNDVLQIPVIKQQSKTLSISNIKIDIVFEDEDVIVINKPAGLVVHPAPGNEHDTLINALFHKVKLSPGTSSHRPGVVHRLDKNSSGLLLLTKNQKSQDVMIEQFKTHKVKRSYWAICLKTPSPIEDHISSYLSRHPKQRTKFISTKQACPGSKQARCSYHVFKMHPQGLAWLNIQLQTGRTHQIRVQLSSLNCPIAGDDLYGGTKKLSFIKDANIKQEIKKLQRTALHAHSLAFLQPSSKKAMVFHASWPKDLKPLLKGLDFL